MRFVISGVQNTNPIQLTIEARSRTIAYQKAQTLRILNPKIRIDFHFFVSLPKPILLAQDLQLLSIMLDSALPIKDALESLVETSPNLFLRQMYQEILVSIQAGISFQKAITPFSRIFSPMGIALLCAGAESGNLAPMFKILSSYFQTLAQNRSNFLKALFYPVFVLLSVCVAFGVIMWFVIPQFSELFLTFDAALPWSTRALIALSAFFTNYVWLLCGLIGGIGVVLWLSIVRKNILWEWLCRGVLFVPLFGKLMLYRDLWAYFLSFSYLYKAHIDLNKTLLLAAQTLQHPTIKNEILQATQTLHTGQNLADAFWQCTFLDHTAKHFLSAAQKSGELTEMLYLSEQYYKNLYEHLISKILTFIEPFSTILIAFVVGWLAFGIFLPIWELGSINL